MTYSHILALALFKEALEILKNKAFKVQISRRSITKIVFAK